MSRPLNRILVVDDEPSVCEALAIGLASHAIAVDVAANGEKGVRLGCTRKYAILIVDLCLPDMDGIEVIRKIKGQHQEIVPIVVTAHSTEESLRQAGDYGVSDYFEKPFALKAIRTAVAKALSVLNPAPR